MQVEKAYYITADWIKWDSTDIFLIKFLSSENIY